MPKNATDKLTNQEISRALKLIRVYSNMKSADLAKKLGLSSGYTSEIEGGSKTISIEILQKYEEVFGVSPSFVFLFANKLKTKKGFEKKIFDSIIKMIQED